MKGSRIQCRFLFLILLLLLLQPAGLSVGAGDSPEEAPNLEISSVYGNLELSRPSSIFVVLKNNASPSEGPDESGLNKENARRIVAELLSSDDRIRVFSGPQMAGLLHAGENVTVQFTALAEGAPLGVDHMGLDLPPGFDHDSPAPGSIQNASPWTPVSDLERLGSTTANSCSTIPTSAASDAPC